MLILLVCDINNYYNLNHLYNINLYLYIKLMKVYFVILSSPIGAITPGSNNPLQYKITIHNFIYIYI